MFFIYFLLVFLQQKIKSTAMKDIHIGKHIHTVFISKGLTVTEFAKRINKSRENIYHVFNRKSIDTDLLLKISEILEYDFFTLYISDSHDKKEIEVLKNEIQLLKEINVLLKQKIIIVE